MRRAFFVVSPEGSGSYMLWNALQQAGCTAKGWHNGHNLNFRFEEMSDLLTIRRSLPHDGRWPPIRFIIGCLKKANYAVTMLVIIREPNATCLSVVRRVGGHSFKKAQKNRGDALRRIYSIPDLSPITITYEAFCLSPGFRKWLFEDRLGLTNPVDFEIKYANEKYYA